MTKQSKKITMSKRRRKDKTKGLVPETSKRKNNQKQKQYSKKEFKIKHILKLLPQKKQQIYILHYKYNIIIQFS